jgi:epoxide hydrolase-like predicted phosphatase
VPSDTRADPARAGASRAVDAVLFDYGGVFTPSPFAAAEAYAVAIGAEPEVLVEVVFGSYDTDGDHAWHRLERGEVAFVEAIAEIAANAQAAGFAFEAGEMFRSIAGDHIDREVVIEAVRRARAHGARTAILTNNIKEYGEAWRRTLPVDELFDCIVDSSHEGVRKPDPAIYRIALERVGVADPSRAVFLDDFAANVEAARALGMHGIVVGSDPRPALDALDALLSGAAPPPATSRPTA